MLNGWTKCRECGEQLKFAFDSRSVVEAYVESAPTERSPPLETPEALGFSAAQAQSDLLNPPTVRVGEWWFRLPTSRDLAFASEEKSERAAMRRLLTSCWAGSGTAVAEWSDEEVSAIEVRLAEADPLAEISLHFDCPACSAAFDEVLDLGEFVWAQIKSRAKRILRDVHLLASAYGWSESQILSLSPARRVEYVEMVLA
jgi:hypothetical protein